MDRTSEAIKYIITELQKGNIPSTEIVAERYNLSYDYTRKIVRVAVDVFYLLKNSNKVYWVDEDYEDDKDELLIKYLIKIEKLKQELKVTKSLLNEHIRNEAKEDSFIDKFLSKIEPHLSRLVEGITFINDSGSNQLVTNKENKRGLSINVILSDWHIGEIVDNKYNQFNIDIACARLEHLSKEIQRKANLYSHEYNIDEINIFLLGDMVSGNIHEELKETNDLTDVEQVLWTANLISLFIVDMYRICPNINIFGIVGNHGRLRKKKQFKNIHNSFDFLSYHLSKAYIKSILGTEANVNYIIPEESEIVVNIRDKWNFYLHHGDNVYSYRNIPYYGLDRNAFKKKAFYVSYEDININAFIHGHFHLPSISYHGQNHIKIINGSLKGVDEYVMSMGEFSDPCQIVFGSTDENIIEFFDLINLRNAKKVEKYKCFVID